MFYQLLGGGFLGLVLIQQVTHLFDSMKQFGYVVGPLVILVLLSKFIMEKIKDGDVLSKETIGSMILFVVVTVGWFVIVWTMLHQPQVHCREILWGLYKGRCYKV